MRYDKGILIALACVGLAGCVKPDSVLFVTDTSLGINVETKPATVSVAFDRIEGYIAPRYDNGALPPVVASIQTGGTVFNPRIRQVYATGAAAVRAVRTPGAPTGPSDLTGGKQLVFFGTATTVGFKAGFDTGTPVPDSLLFGYRRKEFSYIPLGTVTDPGGQQHDTYASALASVDSNTTTTGALSGASGAGLTHAQFIATGLAADTLAVNPDIQRAFGTVAANALNAPPAAVELSNSLAKISALLPSDPVAFKAALPGVVAKAYPDPTNPAAVKLNSFTSKSDLMAYLGQSPIIAEWLADKNS
ncbi:MAG: hypothetical protein WDN08_03450 [Rhizomicrobium sp.]